MFRPRWQFLVVSVALVVGSLVVFWRVRSVTAPGGGLMPASRIDRGPLTGVLAQRDSATGKVRIATGALSTGGAASAQAAAAAVLESSLPELADNVRFSDLRVARQVETLSGTKLTYEHFVQGMPVLGDRIDVAVSLDNVVTRIDNALSSMESQVSALPSVADMSARLEQAAQRAVRAVAATGITSIDARPAVVASKTGTSAVVGVTFVSRSPAGSWRVVTDATAESVLSQINVAQFADPAGLVFRPNPIQSSGNAKLLVGSPTEGPGGLDAFRLLTPLRDLDASGMLQGTYVTTAPMSSRAKEAAGDFRYSRRDPRFGEVMVYHWITECQHYLQELGFVNTPAARRAINFRAIPVDAHHNTEDNSFYSPDYKTLHFGDGGVPDSEDAEVILHELAHAIQDDQVPGFGGSLRHTEARAMGEGFGDYWAASFFSGIGPAAWRVFFDKWDGQAFNAASASNPPYLRRLDRAKKFRADWVGQEHADGEMWSASLWAIHQLVGRKLADTMILQSHYSLPAGGQATFAQGAEAILQANRELNAGQQEAAIRAIFVERGILAPP